VEKAAIEQHYFRSLGLVPTFLVGAALCLTMLGMVMLFSAGAVRGAQDLLAKQSVWLGVALVAGTVSAWVDLEFLKKKTPLIFGLCIFGLILTLLPGVGVKVNGAQRWIGLGPLRVQPSEFLKIGLVLGCAYYFALKQRTTAQFLDGFAIPSAWLGLICGLILLQPDFGTSFLCGAVGATLMFQAGTSLKWLMPVGGLAVTAFSVLVYFDPVRIRRVTSFLDVEANANDSAYQLWQGMLAFGVGGIDGVGLGLGRQQIHFLPEAHTDFIFPVIGEELGMIATMTVLIAFLLLFGLTCWKLRSVSRLYDYLIAMGALLFITFQAIINLGVVTGSLPTKGMSLPFISYGGSNLVVVFILIGLIVNILRRIDQPSPIQAREL
jgi:cell division protein FtsW